MVSEVTRAQSEDLLIDNLDAERPSRAYYAFDDLLKGGVPHFEALVLGFHLGDLVHRPHGHHPCGLVAFTHKTTESAMWKWKTRKRQVNK